ncbi:hypothetical protein AMELA_G00266610 [Ameiurus melas]|uniref:EXPERA domain-containing protein n=1 Tax=Ameiurus melas TaxID=219545 RepID=A0A7J5ZRC8_AMEME|nr:hypothetical protein AMELA_G00266610 [Ameiurus melas]
MSVLNASAGTAVFFLSLLSVPLCYSFNHLITTQSIETVLMAAASVVVILSHLARVLLKRKAPTDPLFYVYALYALLSVVNLIIGLEQDGIIDGFMTFYLKQNVQCEQMKSLFQRPVDLFFVLSLIVDTVFSVLRGLVVLDCPADWCRDYVLNYEPYLKDPTAYPAVQMLVNMLYSAPCVIMMMYGLCVPGCDWLPDLSLVHAGAMAQAQFCHTGASLHTRTPVTYRIPSERLLFFFTFNLFYALVPQVLSYRCITRPAFFISKTQHNRTD